MELTDDEKIKIRTVVSANKSISINLLAGIAQVSENDIIKNANALGIIVDGDTVRVQTSFDEPIDDDYSATTGVPYQDHGITFTPGVSTVCRGTDTACTNIRGCCGIGCCTGLFGLVFLAAMGLWWVGLIIFVLLLIPVIISLTSIGTNSVTVFDDRIEQRSPRGVVTVNFSDIIEIYSEQRDQVLKKGSSHFTMREVSRTPHSVVIKFFTRHGGVQMDLNSFDFDSCQNIMRTLERKLQEYNYSRPTFPFGY